MSDQRDGDTLDLPSPSNTFCGKVFPRSYCNLTTWPHTQRTIHEQISGLPEPVIRKVTWENAALLYQHPVPVAIQEDPDAF